MRLHTIVEMPMHYNVGGEFPLKKPRYTGGKFTAQTSRGYSSPKFYEILSKKLSDWTGRTIILLGGVFWERGGMMSRLAGKGQWGNRKLMDRVKGNHKIPNFDPASLSKVTGIPLSAFQSGITLMLTHDNEQKQLSPWLLLHQLAEELTNDPYHKDLWLDIICNKYREQLEAAFTPDDFDESDDPDLPPELAAYYALFKMRSARTRTVQDHTAELITEFLWHKGHIRINYPPRIDRQVVDAIKNDIEVEINKILDAATGKILGRSPAI